MHAGGRWVYDPSRRHLRRAVAPQSGFVVVALASLALGIGANAPFSGLDGKRATAPILTTIECHSTCILDDPSQETHASPLRFAARRDRSNAIGAAMGNADFGADAGGPAGHRRIVDQRQPFRRALGGFHYSAASSPRR